MEGSGPQRGRLIGALDGQPDTNQRMFEGFTHSDVETRGAVIRVLRGPSSGPPLLLMHGYPQTHAMWHKVAPVLAQRFTVLSLIHISEPTRPY